MKYSNMDWGTMEAVVNKLGGMEGVKLFLRGELEVVAKALDFDTCTFKQLVNYDLSIKELVKEYDWKNDDLTDKNFPSVEKGEKEVEFTLFHFGKSMTSEEAISKMEKSGYRSATIKELLSFGNKYPDLQREFPIVALGSVAKLDGGQCVGSLDESCSERGADLHSYGIAGGGRSRFLAVHK